MSTSSDSSLAELPLPYDISSAVSKALRIKSEGGHESSEEHIMRTRAVSYPTSYLTAYDFPAHRYAMSDGDHYSSCYYQTSNPYFYSTHSSNSAPSEYLYPHHYSTIHPADSHIQMEIDAWGESTTISICNGSSEMLESQMNIEQLDQFCKYIDSNSDEDYIIEKTEDIDMIGALQNDYGCFITGNCTSRLADSPPERKRRKSVGSVALSGYFDEDLEDTVGELRNWRVKLENSSMWREFDRIGTEMVITKAGRRMFPTLSFNVSGLDPKETYSVKLDILPSDNKRYKYLQSEWVAVGRSDKKQIYCEYEHPDSPNSGSYWMDKIIAFKMVKLTNNKCTKCSDQIILNSMHKYIPCMKIVCQNDGCMQTYSYPETTFIAVTAYQSTGICQVFSHDTTSCGYIKKRYIRRDQKYPFLRSCHMLELTLAVYKHGVTTNRVTQLKINNNPYARAFRESIPSTGATGGHHRRSSNSLSPNHTTGDGSRDTTPASSPRHQVQNKPKANCNSTVSVESGFESDTGRKDSTSLIVPSTNPFTSNSVMTYWPDENSLWNPDLITPDSLMDSTSSLSHPYLEDSSHDYDIRRSSEKAILDMLPELNVGLDLANVEAAIPLEDDVFF